MSEKWRSDSSANPAASGSASSRSPDCSTDEWDDLCPRGSPTQSSWRRTRARSNQHRDQHSEYQHRVDTEGCKRRARGWNWQAAIDEKPRAAFDRAANQYEERHDNGDNLERPHNDPPPPAIVCQFGGCSQALDIVRRNRSDQHLTAAQKKPRFRRGQLRLADWASLSLLRDHQQNQSVCFEICVRDFICLLCWQKIKQFQRVPARPIQSVQHGCNTTSSFVLVSRGRR